MADTIQTLTQKNALASDVEVKGSIKFKDTLHIDGTVEGEIFSGEGALTLGPNAVVRGEVKARSVTLYGKVQGNITVEDRCELRGNAQLVGDLKAARLVMEEGASLVGKSEVTPNRVAMKTPEVVPAPAKAPAARLA